MKKTLIVIGILSSLVFSPVGVFAEKIDDYNIDLQIQQNGNVSVVERITYNFENVVDKHGIYRKIPLEKKGGFLSIKDIYTSVDTGITDTKIDTQNNQLLIKIGNPTETISGIRKYSIAYNIERPFVSKNNKENLFFNVVGTDWDVSINNGSFLVTLPLPLSENEIEISCFVGENLSTNSCPSPKLSFDKHGLVNAFLIDSINLKPHEGITLKLSIPKSSLTPTSLIDRCINFLRLFWPFLIVGILGIIFLIIWYKKGRDTKGTGVVVPEYEVPEKMHPLMVAGIIRQGRLSQKDFVASIINLAHLGFISIEIKKAKKILNVKTGNDVYTLKLEKPYSNVDSLDKELLDGIFVEGNRMPGDSVDLSDNLGINELWKKIKDKVKTRLVEEEYFTKSLKRFDLNYHIQFSKKLNIGIVLIFVIVFLTKIFEVLFIPLIFNLTYISIAVIILAIFYFFFIYNYPAKTKKGSLIEEKIKGFKMYLSIAEKHRIHFENPPEVTTEKFSEYLSYAIVLGVENYWAKAFNMNDDYKPIWWHGSDFTMYNITTNMIATTSVNGVFSSSSGDFDGGSVGSGVGGGEGGSW